MSQDNFVFGYWNGSADVFADPLRVDRELRAKSQCQLWTWLRTMREEVPTVNANDPPEVRANALAHKMGMETKQVAAAESIISLVYLVFKMVPFDESTGKGATERNCHAVLTAWLAFVAGEKKNPEPSAPAPTSTPDTPTGQ